MVSTPDPRKDFHHKWWPAEYLVLLQVMADYCEESCSTISLRQTIIACVLECATNRGLDVPDAAYENLKPALSEGIKPA
ncbi:MAG: hypothetical protein KOO60_10865 [Gemmatimonadales bacterium]|nr:hypothetical protein [Gemmatimonadales bacterium]